MLISEGGGSILGGSLLYWFGGYMYTLLLVVSLLILATFFVLPLLTSQDRNDSWVKQENVRESGWRETFSFVRSKMMVIVIFSTILNSLLIIIDVLGGPLMKISLDANSLTYGFYMGSLSIGGLLGALITPMLRFKRIGKLIFAYFIISGISTLLMGMIHIIAIVVFLPFFIGFIASISNIPLMTYLQKIIPRKIMGKTTSLMDTLRIGTAPFSSFGFCVIGAIYGVSNSFIVVGILLLSTSALIPLTLNSRF